MTVRWKALSLFAASAVLYWLSRSLWLDEWDSVQFAMGVRAFNLWEHQPHPPGYPLYIFAARLLAARGMDPVSALVLLSCAAGALFVTAWFLVAREEFGDRFAAVLAVTLAVTPVIWMTATKALTDVPAAAFLGLQLLHAARFAKNSLRRDLVLSAVFGAVAAGIRPQMIGVVIVILLTALAQSRARAREWGIALGVLLAACATWFLPVCYSQAQLDPTRTDWLAYPHQLLKQWRWRLDKPEVYFAAQSPDAGQLFERLQLHLGGWISHGFGLATHGVRRGGRLLLFIGAALFFARARKGHDAFWRRHLPWAILHIFTIFCSLPPDTRYYIPIFPLLWIMILAGGWSLPGRWSALALAPALLMLWISGPLAVAGHSVPPAPIQMLDYLKTRHPPEERDRVWLMMGGGKRHAQWYGSEFKVSLARSFAIDGRSFHRAAALYTDDPHFKLEGRFERCRLEPVEIFERSPLIYPKHARVELFEIIPIHN